jgi:hypothetical protein
VASASQKKVGFSNSAADSSQPGNQ